jgi:EmrB/QacA subfamily drug resistance transporter
VTLHKCIRGLAQRGPRFGRRLPQPRRGRDPQASAKTWTLVAAILGSGIVYLDSTVVTVALPRIGRELPHHLFGVLEGQSYIYTGYLLAQSALLILAGALNDFYGRRRMFAIGVAGFGAMSALCGAAPTMELLVLCRVLQGAAGALLVPGALSLISAAFTGEEEGRAIGTWSGMAAGTTMLGPFVGGILVDTLSWRAAFFMNIPVVVATLWVIKRHVTESRDEESSGQFDIAGTVLTALAVGGLVFGTIYGQQREWRDPLAFVSLAIGAAAGILLPFQMTRAAHPLVPPQLFRSRNFAVTNLSTFVIYGAMAVVFYYVPLFMQGTLGYTAAAVGLATLPPSVFLALFSSRFGALAARYGPRWFMAAGPAIMAIGILWLTRVPAGSQAWVLRAGDPRSFLPQGSYLTDFFPALLIIGIGIMVLVAPLTTALMTSVPVHNAGVASAINNAISDLGPQLINAVIFVAITASFYAGLGARVPGLDTSAPAVRQQISPLNRPAQGTPEDTATAARQASTGAFHAAMLIGTVLLLGGVVINAVGIRNPAASPAGPDPGSAATPANPGRDLIQEQIAYYRARAAEYDASLGNLSRGDWGELTPVIDHLRGLGPQDQVLELASGTGIWTRELARIGRAVTAVDAAPEMLEINRRKLAEAKVVYECADLFHWTPHRTYDLVFAGFWLSHVPPEQLDEFLVTVRRATRPGGRFVAVDQRADLHDSPPIGRDGIREMRAVADGRTFTIVKVYHPPAALAEKLTRLGFETRADAIGESFFWLSAMRRT